MMRPLFHWPYGVHAYCWRTGRMFYIYLNGYGFTFLFGRHKPILVNVVDIQIPTKQIAVRYKDFPSHVRRDISRTVGDVYRLVVQYDEHFCELPVPNAVREPFPLVTPVLGKRAWRQQMFLSNQSQRYH